MIISKPKPTALIALGIFIIICFGVGGYALNNVLSGTAGWFGYATAIIALSLGGLLLIRQLFSYKLIQIGETIKIKYPFRLQTKMVKLKDLIFWQQTIIKTKNEPFKQIALVFEHTKLKISVQENTNYNQVYKFLKKRVGKKEKK